MRIREATRGDLSLLAALISTAFRDAAERLAVTRESYPNHPSFWTEEQVQARLDKGCTFAILEEDGEPCGCVGLDRQREPGLVWIERLSVLPQRRGRGFGRALVLHAAAEARRLGARRVGLGIVAEDQALREWYERLGFALGETKRFDHLPFEFQFLTLDL